MTLIVQRFDQEVLIVHDRFTWLLRLNAFLFAALGILISQITATENGAKLTWFGMIFMIAGIGAISNCFLNSAIKAANLQITYLIKVWEHKVKLYGGQIEETENKELKNKDATYCRPFGSESINIAARKINYLPMILVVMWSIVIAIVLYQAFPLLLPDCSQGALLVL